MGQHQMLVLTWTPLVEDDIFTPGPNLIEDIQAKTVHAFIPSRWRHGKPRRQLQDNLCSKVGINGCVRSSYGQVDQMPAASPTTSSAAVTSDLRCFKAA
jgi:hypothetical protein